MTLVEPAGCNTREGVFIDHPFEGMSVGVKPPLLDWEMVDHIIPIHLESVQETQRWFATKRGFALGLTSAACLSVARSQARRISPGHVVLTLAYDHGLWYPLGTGDSA